MFFLKFEFDGFYDWMWLVDYGVDICCDLVSWRLMVIFELYIKKLVILWFVYISFFFDFFLGEGGGFILDVVYF